MDTPEQLAARIARRQGKKLPPVITRAAILNNPNIHERDKLRAVPPSGSNVGDIIEGPSVSKLLWVFAQLERKGIGKVNR